MPAFDLHGANTVATRPTRGNPLVDGPRFAAPNTEVTHHDINDIVCNLRGLLTALGGDPADGDDALGAGMTALLATLVADGDSIARLDDGGGFVRMTDAERNKLAALANNFKGVHASLAALSGSVSGAAGDWAIISVPGGDATFAVWDSDATVPAWIDTGSSLPASVLKSDTSATLTVGYKATAYNAGTKSTGTFTPDPANGNLQRYVNGGAHTLAAPTAAGDYPITIQIVNDGSAGTITMSGFDLVDGSSLTTTNGHKFRLYIEKINGVVTCTKKALQ